jgi:histidine triad (HIT) family protein
MTDDTVFAKIIRGEIPADIVYEDELCLAFRDISPQAPTHVLVVPRQAITGLDAVAPDDSQLLGHLLVVTRAVAEKEDILASGFRCIINAGAHGGQEVAHLHVHVLGGRPLGPMLN